MAWSYYAFSEAGGGTGYVRIDEDNETAESFDDLTLKWERQDVWFDEVTLNGGGVWGSEEEALAATRLASTGAH